MLPKPQRWGQLRNKPDFGGFAERWGDPEKVFERAAARQQGAVRSALPFSPGRQERILGTEPSKTSKDGPDSGGILPAMAESTGASGSEKYGSRLLRAVEVIAISAEDAQAIAKQYLDQSKERFPANEDWRHQLRAADKIIGRYSRLAAMVGTTSGLPGIFPGLGTAIAVVGGATADSLICMKLQVDMCMCLAAAFKYDIVSEDGKHLTFLIAATGTAQRAGVETGARVGSQAGVRMLRQYLKGHGATGGQAGIQEGRNDLHTESRRKGHPFWGGSWYRRRNQLLADSIRRPSG